MNINKTGSIRKGFAFSKMLFPAVGAFLLVTQSGCGQSLARLGAGAAQPCSQVVAGSSNDKILRLAKASGNYLLEGDAFNINKTMVAVMGGSKQFQEIQKRYGLNPLSTSSQAGSISSSAKREKPKGIGCPAFEARKNLLANLLVGGQVVMDTSVETSQEGNDMKDNKRASQLSSQIVAGSSNDKILRLAKASGNYLLEGDAFNINKTMVAVMGGSKQFQEIQERYGLSPLSTSSQAGSISSAKREKPEGIGCPAFEARKNLLANLLVGQMVMDTSVATDQKNNNVEDGGVPQPPSNVVSTSSIGGALPKPPRSKPSQPEKPSIKKQSPSDKKGNSRVRAYFKKLSRELRTTPWFGI